MKSQHDNMTWHTYITVFASGPLIEGVLSTIAATTVACPYTVTELLKKNPMCMCIYIVCM